MALGLRGCPGHLVPEGLGQRDSGPEQESPVEERLRCRLLGWSVCIGDVWSSVSGLGSWGMSSPWEGQSLRGRGGPRCEGIPTQKIKGMADTKATSQEVGELTLGFVEGKLTFVT